MKKVFLLFSVTFLFLSHIPLRAQTFEWAAKSGTSVIATGSSIATDGQGNSYMTGSFFGTCKFGDFQLYAQGRDAYLVKYDKDAKVIWAKRIGGRADDFGNAVAVDKDGNCYLTGSFAFTINFGTDSLISRGLHDLYIAKYNSKGELIWCRDAGGHSEDFATALSLDKSGNCYIAGYFKDSIAFADGKIISGKGSSAFSIFLAKYDSKGNVMWVKSIGSSNYATQSDGLAIATDPSGMTYVTGYYQHEAEFDGKKFTNRGSNSLFVAKYNGEGKLEWVKTSGEEGASVVGKAIAVDKKGNCFVTGTFITTAMLDSVTIKSKNLGYYDVFLAKYNSAGNILWARGTTGFGAKFPYDVCSDAEGNPYVLGTFSDTAIFGNVTVSAGGSQTIFLIKYNASGQAQWAKQSGRYGAVLGRAMSFDPSGNLYVTGNFSDTVDLGKIRLTALKNTQDVFCAKLSPRSNIKEKKLAEPPSADFTFISCSFDPKSMTATVKYSIPKPRFVLLNIDNIMGTVAESYIEGQHDAGTYEAKLDLKNFKEDGEYYCRLQAGSEKQTKKFEIKK